MTMPLRDGYGYDIVSGNVNTLIADGVQHVNAIAAAYARGRVSYFRRFPHGALPQWLAYPRKYRMREHYDAHGHSSLTNVREFRENPSAPNPRKLAQAAQLFEDFSGRKAARITKHSLPELPTEGLAFGRLVQVGYESARDGRLYRHTFRERSRPLLVATPDGKTVLIVGGRYAFTDAGIEDR
jgi:hypothetical protein